jgi:hypothetical protein
VQASIGVRGRNCSGEHPMTNILAMPKQKLAHPVSIRMSEMEDRMRRAHDTHLGYPYNLIGHNPVAPSLSGYLVNNLGDPYVGSHL